MSRRDIGLIIGLTIVLLFLGLIAGDPTRDEDPRPSSYLTSPGGTAALALTLEEIGFEVERRLTPLDELDSLRGPLVMLAPTQEVTPAELRELNRWVRAGGTLIYGARQGDATLDSLGVSLKGLQPDTLRLLDRRWAGAPALPAAHPLSREVRQPGDYRMAFSVPDTVPVEPLLTTPGGEPVALVLERGAGRVIALSDVGPLRNGLLGENDAAVLFVRAATTPQRRVVFDEYHHGFRPDGSPGRAMLHFLRTTGPGRLLLQLGLATAGFILLLGVRFGPADEVQPARRRDPLEHVDALASAYRQAGARGIARARVLNGLMRALGQPTSGLGKPVDFEALRRGTPTHAHAAVAALQKEWEKGDHSDLITLAAAADEVITRTQRKG